MLKPQTKLTWSELGIKGYSDYFKTKHWYQIKRLHITNNDKARCYVCSRKNRLVLHHNTYRHLGKEKINKDIYVVCYSCHEKIHFYFFKLIKIPLTKRSLQASLFLRRSLHELKIFRVFHATFYLFRSLLSLFI